MSVWDSAKASDRDQFESWLSKKLRAELSQLRKTARAAIADKSEIEKRLREELLTERAETQKYKLLAQNARDLDALCGMPAYEYIKQLRGKLDQCAEVLSELRHPLAGELV